MNNQLKPDDNHFDDFMEEKEEKTESVDIDENEEEEETNSKPKISKEQYRARMLKLLGIVVIAFIVIVVIGLLIYKFGSKKSSYAEVESIMRDAAISYFQDHKDSLPTSGANVEIYDSTLTEEGYMKALNRYIVNTECTGKVVVSKKDKKEYSYSAYLDCGSTYKTKELYKAVINKSNIVTSGYGLYSMNGEYVYRGKNVDNYVKFNDSDVLWRVVKVTKNNETVLVQNGRSTNQFAWDERYNSVLDDNSGINVYNNSNISLVLKTIYKGNFGDDTYEYDKNNQYDEEIVLLTKQDKEKVIKHNACVGGRSENDSSKDGSSECSTTAKLSLSLLPVYDFMNASIDPGCKTTVSPECQNYNYLNDYYNYWLATGDKDNSEKVYAITGELYPRTREAYNEYNVRVVIHVGTDVMVEKGKGTLKNPYIIR